MTHHSNALADLDDVGRYARPAESRHRYALHSPRRRFALFIRGVDRETNVGVSPDDPRNLTLDLDHLIREIDTLG